MLSTSVLIWTTCTTLRSQLSSCKLDLVLGSCYSERHGYSRARDYKRLSDEVRPEDESIAESVEVEEDK